MGNLLEEHIPNDFYHDIFILKGIASNPHYGVKKHLKDKIDYTDFWILNTSKYPITLKSKNGNFSDRYIEGHSISLVKTDAYMENDITCEYLGEKVTPTPINS